MVIVMGDGDGGSGVRISGAANEEPRVENSRGMERNGRSFVLRKHSDDCLYPSSPRVLILIFVASAMLCADLSFQIRSKVTTAGVRTARVCSVALAKCFSQKARGKYVDSEECRTWLSLQWTAAMMWCQ